MFDFDQTLLIRALNSSRQAYFPTYMGLRLIGDQLPQHDNLFLQNLIKRRLTAGDQWRFKSYDLYKNSHHSSKGIKHEYRECLAGSPITTIAESFILALLASDKSFAIPERVYSYRWPKSSKSGASYEFFAQGYMQRNTDIANALSQENTIAIVTDIKSFYPSVQTEQITNALNTFFDNSDQKLKVWREAIIEFYAQLIAAGKNGIPIGPASAHVLGHLVLKDVDNELTNKYGNCYFRYVDDIVIVCEVQDKEKVKKHLNDCIEKNGFSLNEDKTSILTHDDWKHNVLRSDISHEDNFRSFTSDLVVYLAYHPDRAESLKPILSKAGLSIPVDRLLALSSYNRYRYFLSGKKSRFGLAHLVDLAFFKKNENFLHRGMQLKTLYEQSLQNLTQEIVETLPNFRRLQIQRARRVINTLFYLRNFEEWDSKNGTFELWPELLEQKALSVSLNTGIVDSILPFYGRGPAAFSEIWLEHGNGDAQLSSTKSINNAEIEGLINLRLTGVFSSENLKDSEINNSRMFNIVNTKSTKRTIPDLSYEDEFESLMLGSSDSEISKIARSRYSHSEGTALSALTLLSSEFRS